MKFTEGAFRNWGYEVARDEFGSVTITEEQLYGEFKGKQPEGKIVIKDRIADITFQMMLLRPGEFDVIATTNLNGDYLSDAIAAAADGGDDRVRPCAADGRRSDDPVPDHRQRRRNARERDAPDDREQHQLGGRRGRYPRHLGHPHSPRHRRQIVRGNKSPSAIRVNDIASRPAVSVPVETSIREEAALIADASYSRLTVAQGGKIIGIVTETDIFNAVEKFGWASE